MYSRFLIIGTLISVILVIPYDQGLGFFYYQLPGTFFGPSHSDNQGLTLPYLSTYKTITSYNLQHDFDTQSVRSYNSLASTLDHSSVSPGSSRNGYSQGSLRSAKNKKQKKTSLPAEFQLMPMMSNAMNLAVDQIGRYISSHILYFRKFPKIAIISLLFQ